MTKPDQTSPLALALRERILLLDGAYGTLMQSLRLNEQDYRGNRFADHPTALKGNHDVLSLTRPEIVAEAHRRYLRAGADVIKTNSFTATRITQADYQLEEEAEAINAAAAQVARETADEFSTAGQRRFVAGVLGPTTRTASLSPDVNDPSFRNVDFSALSSDYLEAARALMANGADFILIETVFDTLNAKAAVYAISKLSEETGSHVPLMISGTI